MQLSTIKITSIPALTSCFLLMPVECRTRKPRAERLANDDARRALASRKNSGLSDCNNIGLKGNKKRLSGRKWKKNLTRGIEVCNIIIKGP